MTIDYKKGRSHGLVVIGGGLWSTGCEFGSWHRKLEHLFVVKIGGHRSVDLSAPAIPGLNPKLTIYDFICNKFVIVLRKGRK